MLLLRVSENGMNEWSVERDIGRHHHDVRRGKDWHFLEKTQKIIVKDFDFPQGAVAGMHLD